MKLSCREAQHLISPYLTDEISNRDCSAFLSHVEDCPKCMHELETSFMITYALKHMDTADNFTFDIKGLLQEKIRKSKLRLQMSQFTAIVVWILIVLMGIAIVFIVFSLFFRDSLPDFGKELLEIILSAIDRTIG